MITFQVLVNAAPQISDKLLGPKEYLIFFGIALLLGMFLYSVYVTVKYIFDESKKRKVSQKILSMMSQTNQQLSRDLWKLKNDPRLPTSYFGVKPKNLDERYKMVDDFMKICKRRNIKEE